MGALATLFGMLFQTRQAEIPRNDDQYIVPNSELGSTVMVRQMLSIPSVWAAIHEISETIALLPMEIQDADGNPIENLLPAEDDLLTNFRKNIETAVIHLLIHGDNFQLIIAPNTTTGQLRLVNPSYIRKVIQEADGSLVYDTEQGMLTEDEVLQVRGPSYDGVRGISLIALMADALKMAIYTNQNASKSFERGYPVVFARQRPDGAVMDLSDLGRLIKNALTGNGIVGLPSKVEGIESMPSNTDMQLIEAIRQQPILAAQMFRIPASRIGFPDDSTYNNRVQDAIRYANDTIAPIVRRFEEAFTERFLEGAGRQLVIDTSGVYEMTFEERARLYQELAGNEPLISRNEAREGIDYEPIDDGDDMGNNSDDADRLSLADAMIAQALSGGRNGASEEA